MSSIDPGNGPSFGRNPSKRVRKNSTHIDMTPMVDLAFLLLTFFIFTTTFNRHLKLDIITPEIKGPPTPVGDSQILSILLASDDRIMWYEGMGGPDKQLVETNYAQKGKSSLSVLLKNKNRYVIDRIHLFEDSIRAKMIEGDSLIRERIFQIKSDKDGLVVLIKPDSSSKYRNLVDVLDELNDAHVGRYSIADVSVLEKEAIKLFTNSK